MKFEIPDIFLGHIDLAVTRLNYLYPDLKISYQDNQVTIDVQNQVEQIDLEKDLKKELFYQLYRAKIYQDTLPMKKWLFSKNEEKPQ